MMDDAELIARLREAAQKRDEFEAVMLASSAAARIEALIAERDVAVQALVEALRPFADIFVGQNPDWQPLVRLDRDAIIAVRAALAAFDNTKEDK